jgi:hypothetical protein
VSLTSRLYQHVWIKDSKAIQDDITIPAVLLVNAVVRKHKEQKKKHLALMFSMCVTTETTSYTSIQYTVKPRFNVPAFSEILDLVIFSCPDNSSV